MPDAALPKISFGIIVLNGEPFIRYNLRALYPLAHQIIVVEGACPSAQMFATPEGHSTDRTLEILRQFQQAEDPEKKITLVTAEEDDHPNGFWSEKDEMSQAYSRRATGNFLWQVDIDEFYCREDMEMVIAMVQTEKITAVSFRALTFWGGLNYRTDGIFLRQGERDFKRLFAWGPGYRYMTHRPPTVINEAGHNLLSIRAVTAEMLARRGIYLYHYSFVFPFQARFKVPYYSGLDRSHGLSSKLIAKRQAWLRNYSTLQNPFFVDDTSIVRDPSWLRRYNGKHPEVILQLWQDIEQGKIKVELRATDDIEHLVRNPMYKMARYCIPIAWKPVEWARSVARAGRRIIRAVYPLRAEESLR